MLVTKMPVLPLAVSGQCYLKPAIVMFLAHVVSRWKKFLDSALVTTIWMEILISSIFPAINAARVKLVGVLIVRILTLYTLIQKLVLHVVEKPAVKRVALPLGDATQLTRWVVLRKGFHPVNFQRWLKVFYLRKCLLQILWLM